MQMLFWDSSTAGHPVEVMYNVQKKRTAVAASKDLQVGELKIAPWASDLGNLSTDSKHLLDPDRTIIKVTLSNKAEKAASQGKPQEKLNVKEMLQASSAVAAAPADSSQDVVFVCLLRHDVAPVWEPAPENTNTENSAWRYEDKTNLHAYWQVEADLHPKAADPLDTRVKRVRVLVNQKKGKKDAYIKKICPGSLLTSLTKFLSET